MAKGRSIQLLFFGLVAGLLVYWRVGPNLRQTHVSAPVAVVHPDETAESSTLVTMTKNENITSKEGDLCRKMSEKNDSHPLGYGPGFNRKEVKFYCLNPAGNYALANVGVYKNGILVSSQRQKLKDGRCKLVKEFKEPISDDKWSPPKKGMKAELRSQYYSCYLHGRLVIEGLSGVLLDDKPISMRAKVRDVASILDDARKKP